MKIFYILIYLNDDDKRLKLLESFFILLSIKSCNRQIEKLFMADPKLQVKAKVLFFDAQSLQAFGLDTFDDFWVRQKLLPSMCGDDRQGQCKNDSSK